MAYQLAPGVQVSEPTSDGIVSFTPELKVGELTILVKDRVQSYALLRLDRTKDNSTEPYSDILTRWISKAKDQQLQLLSVGELTVDDSDLCNVFYHMDDEILAVVTTHPVALSMPIVSGDRKDTSSRFLHMQHQLLSQSSEAMPRGPIAGQIADLHIGVTLRNQTANGQCAGS
jgi:hypothetical protein